MNFDNYTQKASHGMLFIISVGCYSALMDYHFSISSESLNHYIVPNDFIIISLIGRLIIVISLFYGEL